MSKRTLPRINDAQRSRAVEAVATLLDVNRRQAGAILAGSEAPPAGTDHNVLSRLVSGYAGGDSAGADTVAALVGRLRPEWLVTTVEPGVVQVKAGEVLVEGRDWDWAHIRRSDGNGQLADHDSDVAGSSYDALACAESGVIDAAERPRYRLPDRRPAPSRDAFRMSETLDRVRPLEAAVRELAGLLTGEPRLAAEVVQASVARHGDAPPLLSELVYLMVANGLDVPEGWGGSGGEVLLTAREATGFMGVATVRLGRDGMVTVEVRFDRVDDVETALAPAYKVVSVGAVDDRGMYVPLTVKPEPFTLDLLTDLDPHVAALLDRATAVGSADHTSVQFCKPDVFFEQFKPDIIWHIGWARKVSDMTEEDPGTPVGRDGALRIHDLSEVWQLESPDRRRQESEDFRHGHALLRTSRAYDAVYQAIWNLLPDCRKCRHS